MLTIAVCHLGHENMFSSPAYMSRHGGRAKLVCTETPLDVILTFATRSFREICSDDSFANLHLHICTGCHEHSAAHALSKSLRAALASNNALWNAQLAR